MYKINYSCQSAYFTHNQYEDMGIVHNRAHILKGTKENTQQGYCSQSILKAREIRLAVQHGNTEFFLAHEQLSPTCQRLCGFLYAERKNVVTYFVHDLCTTTPEKTGVGAVLLLKFFQKAVEEKIQKIEGQSTLKSLPFYKQFLFEKDFCPAVQEDVDMSNTRIEETCHLLQTRYGHLVP